MKKKKPKKKPQTVKELFGRIAVSMNYLDGRFDAVVKSSQEATNEYDALRAQLVRVIMEVGAFCRDRDKADKALCEEINGLRERISLEIKDAVGKEKK